MGPLLCFMKKHISFEHPVVWCRWTNVNLTLATKYQHTKKSKKRTIVRYGAIINHFGSTTPYRKDNVGQKQSMENLLLFVAKMYMPISTVENQWLK
jgi:hypothetical protein